MFAIREGSRLHRLRASALASLVDEDWIVRDEFLIIDLAPFVRRTKERMDRLAAARELVVSDPETNSGHACPSRHAGPRLWPRCLSFWASPSSYPLPTRRS